MTGDNGCLVTLTISSTYPLNDTGINWYGSVNQNFLFTPPADFEGQDADYGQDAQAQLGVLVKEGDGNGGFDFTKLDENGNDLSASDTSWSCVRDNHTGLVWEVKTKDGGLHGQKWKYSWYNSDSVTNGSFQGWVNLSGACGSTLSHCSTEAYVTAVNEAGLCGANDWRLPNRQELQSINDYGRIAPSIDTAYFPDTTGECFWSSSPVASSTYHFNAWCIDSYSGETVSSGKQTGLSVRLVRGEQGIR